MPSPTRPAVLLARLAFLFAFAPPACAVPQSWPPAEALDDPAGREAGPLPPSVRARRPRDGSWAVRFSHEAPEARAVSLVGSFNGWQPGRTPMRRRGSEWAVELRLPAGEHQYKFHVDGDWRRDPRNEEGIDDGHLGLNSVLRLGRLAHLERSPARRGDGSIDAAALRHDPDGASFVQRLRGGGALLRYRLLAHDAERVLVAVRGRRPEPMTRATAGKLLETWELRLSELAPGEQYTFVLEDGDTRKRDPQLYTMQNSEEDTFLTPDWARHAIWYQVMLDRFRNGDPTNDPEHTRPWTSDWWSESPWERESEETFYESFVYRRFYGGDLQGLVESLAYLEDLGVNALYLNPVFQATTPHKYNATSFLHVDEHFGSRGDYAAAEAREDLLDPSTWTWTDTDKLFLEFLQRAKERGMRVILDGVFNHVGTEHPAFRDVRERGEDSTYADWFAITSRDPFEYQGWAGFGELPVFRKSADGIASEAVKEHIFAVTRRWMDPDGDGDPSDGIDGWRLDVPNEIAKPFWTEWRALVKSINPDAYISGEIWGRADDWLGADGFDAVMNYEFAKTAIAWIGDRKQKIGAAEAERRLTELRLAYPDAATSVMMNLVDSHDTDRLVSMLQNPDLPYDRQNRPQDDNEKYDNGRPKRPAYQKARLVALLQMTYLGAPMIYYGDEVGMWGADDPTNRKPMLWKDLEPYEKPEENRVHEAHLDWYRRVIALRRDHEALRTGTIRTLHAEDVSEVWAFLRESEEERLLVILHAGTGEADVRLLPPVGDWKVVLPARGARLDWSEDGLRVRIGSFRGMVLAAPRI